MSDSGGYVGFRDTAGEDGSETNALRSLFKAMLSEVATSMVVRIVGTRRNGVPAPLNGEVAAPGSLDVVPLVHQIDGAANTYPHGPIYNVPYHRQQNGQHGIIMDPKVGDVGVIVCASRDISAVKATQGAASPPGSFRRHDLADAIYIGTMIAKGPPQQFVQFTDDGLNLVSLGTISISAQTILLNGHVIQQGGSVTSNGKHIDNTHVHGNVKQGSDTTSGPVN